METIIDTFFQQLENDPEIRVVKNRLTDLEARIKGQVPSDAWALLPQWEAEWAHYLTLCIKRFYPLAYSEGWDACLAQYQGQRQDDQT